MVELREVVAEGFVRDFKAHVGFVHEPLRVARVGVTAAHETLIVYARTDPGAVFEQMVDAHQALQIKLNDPDARLQDLAGSIQDFYQTSRDVLIAIRAARVKLEGGSDS